MDDSESGLQEQIRSKNKKKLLNQNIKLHAEIKRLQSQIEALEDDQTIKQQPNSQNISSFKSELQAQERQIKRLKEKIEAGRHANIKQNVMYIQKEENELIYLKRQEQELREEKTVITDAREDKLKKLSNNQPLEKHKDAIKKQWADTKKQNRELNLKMVEMEREIRKYHSIKEKAKNKQINSNSQEGEEQLARIDLEIERMIIEMKTIENKWGVNIDVLDKQFFAMKNQLSTLQKKIEGLEKEEDSWKRRAAAIRNQNQLSSDRERLSKIVAMPKTDPSKREQVSQRYHLNSGVKGYQLTKIRQNIKSHNLSLPRAQSTPNPPTLSKRSLQTTQLKDLTKPKIKQEMKREIISKSKEVIQELPQQQKVEKNKFLKELSIKSEQRLESPQKIDKNVAKKSYAEIRGKHRIKSMIPASPQPEQVPRKVEQVKSKVGNANRQKILVPSPNKNTSKTANTKLNSMQQRKIETTKEPVKSPLSPKLQKEKSSSSIKNLPIAQSNQKKVTIQEITKITNGKVNQPKKASNNKNQEKKKEKELLVSLDMKTVEKRVSSPPKNKTQENNQKDQKVKSLLQSKSREKLTVIDQTRQQIKGLKINSSPLSPKQKHSKASPKQAKTQVPTISVELQDQEDDVPKVIRRKRAPQGDLVTTGTST